MLDASVRTNPHACSIAVSPGPAAARSDSSIQEALVPRPREYVIYCDESVSKGAHFSNFYGGALVTSDNIDSVRSSIAAKKADLNLHGEVKWSKITENYKQKYIDRNCSPRGG